MRGMNTYRIAGTPALTTAITSGTTGEIVGRIRRDRPAEYAAPGREDGPGICDHALHHMRSGRWVETWYSIWVRPINEGGGHEGHRAQEISPADAAHLIARWGLQVPAELAPLCE